MGLCSLFAFPACQKEKGLNDSYWRNEQTGEWMVGLVNKQMIYNSCIWDIVEQVSNSKDEDCQRIIDEYNVKGPNVVHHNLPKEQQNLVQFYLGVSSYPTYVLIDPDGDILDVKARPSDLDVLYDLMKRLTRE